MAAKETAKKIKKKEDMVTITLDRPAKGEDTHQFVNVNGRTYRVVKGKPVSVPRAVAEVIINSVQARDVRDAYEEAATEKMAAMERL